MYSLFLGISGDQTSYGIFVCSRPSSKRALRLGGGETPGRLSGAGITDTGPLRYLGSKGFTSFLQARTTAVTAVTTDHQPPPTHPGPTTLPAGDTIAAASLIVLTRAATTMTTTTTKPDGSHTMDAVILIARCNWNGSYSECYLYSGCRRSCRLIRGASPAAVDATAPSKAATVTAARVTRRVRIGHPLFVAAPLVVIARATHSGRALGNRHRAVPLSNVELSAVTPLLGLLVPRSTVGYFRADKSKVAVKRGGGDCC
ncbi:hypothetical protein F5144DRAFT_231917 [Chaetomium tenue]|uniref:Uncharacterized protein n=1 Tax=Chaetomium tenue TaxID=1854479 RepID=A0ACB7P663_9PEZI|nr:hypothetical protein F5144DRAFT_231917 [Chaetomium globosum]